MRRFLATSAAAAMIGLGLAAAAGAVLGAEADQAPQWLRKPTPAELYTVFPTKALEAGIDGSATIACEAAPDGVVRGCRVVSEEPAGMGFGAAALALAPQFLMKPATRDGRPVSAVVHIPISFKAPSGSGSIHRIAPPSEPSGRTITRMVWESVPSSAEIAAAAPAAATAGGYVILDCVFTGTGQLRRCHTAREEPERKGLAKAAQSLIPRFQAGVSSVKGESIEGVHTLVTIRFDPPGSPTAGMARQVEWIRAPAPEDLTYPAAAKAAGAREGRAVIDCLIEASGVLADCRLVEETPGGLGFGAAGLSLAPKFRVNPWSVEGRPVGGKRIRLPIGFVDDLAPAASAEAAR